MWNFNFKDFSANERRIQIHSSNEPTENSENMFTTAVKELFTYNHQNLRKKRELSNNNIIKDEPSKSIGSFVKNVLTKSTKNKCAATQQHQNIRHNRIKRNLDELDPLNNLDVINPPLDSQTEMEYKRNKRRAQEQLNFLHQEFTRCSRNADSNCDDIYNKFVALTQEVNARFSEFANDFKQIHNGGGSSKKTTEEKIDSETKKPDEITTKVSPTTNKETPIPKKTEHRDEANIVGQTYLGDGFFYSYQHPPKVHEDLTSESKKLHSSNRQETQHDEHIKTDQNSKTTDTQVKPQDLTGSLQFRH